MDKFNFFIYKTWNYLKAVTFIIAIRPLISPWIRPKNHWVISGHRGRAYLDNAALLHSYIATETSQEIIWITKDSKTFQKLQDSHQKVLWKNSFSARCAILQARALIYSHGEDDLDSHLLYWLKLPGLRIYLNHSLNLIKTGQMAQKNVAQLSGRALEKFKSQVTRFDYILSSSEQERIFFKRSFLARDDQYLLGGGAHLDQFFRLKQENPPQHQNILYFPTFRDSAAGNLMLEDTLQALYENSELNQWLIDHGVTFTVCHHINTKIRFQPEPESPFSFQPSSQIINLLKSCRLFISDYSGLIPDYLILEKPFVAFPFDLDDYLKIRNFYTDYKDIAYGPICQSIEALVESISTGEAFDLEKFAAIRESKMNLYFPHKEAIYSAKCYESIVELTSKKDH